MIFGPTPLDEARGAILAHTLRLPGRVLKKGTVLDEAAVAALKEAGRREVIAARLEAGDVAEDEAADRIANLLMAPLVARSRASTGRVNLFAESAGLFTVDAALVDRLNGVDESVTIATLPDRSVVAAKEMLATIKIIPFAVSGAVLGVIEALAKGRPPVAVQPFRPLSVGLVLTELPGIKESVMEGATEATDARVRALMGTLLPVERVRHEEGPVAEALTRLRKAGADLLLIAGASAVVDRRDVGPAAIMRAGGAIEHFGMPVDPGNLICLGRIGRGAGHGAARLRAQPEAQRLRLGAPAHLLRRARDLARHHAHGRRRPAEGDRGPPPAPRRGAAYAGLAHRAAEGAPGLRARAGGRGARAGWRR